MKKLSQVLSVFILLMIALSFFTVFVSYFFNWVFISVQELIIYLHSSIFMLGIVYAFSEDKHVRIDIFYQSYSARKKRKVNLWGSVFLLIPLFAFMFYISLEYVMASWSKLEGSPESGGLPFVYGLKSLILILPISMIAYSITQMFRKP